MATQSTVLSDDDSEPIRIQIRLEPALMADLQGRAEIAHIAPHELLRLQARVCAGVPVSQLMQQLEDRNSGNGSNGHA